eukprot:5030846-Pyramimonas_sp.AAC.1
MTRRYRACGSSVARHTAGKTAPPLARGEMRALPRGVTTEPIRINYRRCPAASSRALTLQR